MQEYRLTEQVTGVYVVVIILSNSLLFHERIYLQFREVASFSGALEIWFRLSPLECVYTLLRKHISATAPGPHMCSP